MMVNKEQIINGATRWFDTEFMPQLPPNSIKQVLAGTAIAILLKRANYIIENFSTNSLAKSLKLSDENGNMDIDDIYDELKRHIPDRGLSIDIPLLGKLTIKRSDIESLYGFIQEA